MSRKTGNKTDSIETITEASNSGGTSPVGSNIFIVKPNGKQANQAQSDPFRHEPVTVKNFGQIILRGIRSLWATRQTEKDLQKNKDLYVKTTIREIVIYLIFISVLCIITFGMTSTKTFYFTAALRTIFTEQKVEGAGDQPAFDDIASYEDFFNVMTKPVLQALLNDKWYNDQSIVPGQQGYVLHENKILGLPRLRQLRVKNNSCTVHKKFQGPIHECYAPYSSRKRDESPYTKPNVTNLTNEAWSYRSSSELGGSSTTGLISTYGSDGYALDLRLNFSEALDQFNELKDNIWLNRGTRAVILDFTVYNANINLFCQIKLLVEFPAAGGAVPSKQFQSVKLIRYVSTMDYFVLACEILYIIFTVYYTVEEIIEIKHYKMQYFKTVWNILDVLILLISYVCIAFNIYRQVKVGELLDKLIDNQNHFTDFEFLTYWQTQFNNVIAFTVFLAWIKIFKYVSFNKTMTQLSTTLSRCAKDVFGFSVMFMIVFLAYAQLGYLLFGSMINDYKTFSTSIFTLFRIILGDFDFEAILNIHRILAPIFFLTYVFFVFFVLLNMFLAIINETYSEVKNDMNSQKSEFELRDYFKKSYDKVLNRLHVKRDRIIDIQAALKDADVNKDGVVEFEEWRKTLKARGYTDAEIENVFSRYDVDGDRVLCNNEQLHFKSDLIAQENSLDMDINDIKNNAQAMEDSEFMSYDQFHVAVKRVDRMEYSVGNLVSQIEIMISKLVAMEKVKKKRREGLQKILDTMTEDNGLNKEDKQARLEKMIREVLEEKDPDSKPPGAPATPDDYRSSVSLRQDQPSRTPIGKKLNQN